MFKRQSGGSVVCRSCGLLVGVNDPECLNCGAKNPGLWGYAPMLKALGDDLGFVNLIMFATGLLYLASLAIDPGGISSGGLSFFSPSGHALFALGASGSLPFYEYRRWWTLLSAGWLHGGALHILFNLYWVRQMVPLTAEIYGGGRTILIYCLSSAAGFFATSTAGLLIGDVPFLRGASLTVGASAALFGLFGAVVYSGRRGGSSHVSRQIQSLAVMLFLMGLVLPVVDNWAHAGGFAGGYLLARWLDPMWPERINHLAWAAALLVMTALSVLLSLATSR